MYTAYLCQKSSIHTLSFILGPTSSQNLFRSLTTQLFTSSIWQDLQSILMNHGPQEIQDTHHWDHGPLTKHFSYLKWRNPHTCKLYVFRLMDTGKPTPKIAIINLISFSPFILRCLKFGWWRDPLTPPFPQRCFNVGFSTLRGPRLHPEVWTNNGINVVAWDVWGRRFCGAEDDEIFPNKKNTAKTWEFWSCLFGVAKSCCLVGSGLKSFWLLMLLMCVFCVPHKGSYTVTSQNIHYICPNQRYDVCSKKSIPNLKPT